MMKQLLAFLLIFLMSSHAFANESTNKSSEQLQEIIDLLQSNANEEALSQLKLHESDLVTSIHESKDAEAYMLLAQAYFLAEMDAKAMEAYKSALLLDPSLSEAYFFIGLIRRYADDLEGAEKSFREAIAANGKEEKYFIELGRTLEMKNDLTSASTAYKNALALDETNVDANSSLATIYAIEGDVNSAEKHFIATIEQNPNDLDTQYNLVSSIRIPNNIS